MEHNYEDYSITHKNGQTQIFVACSRCGRPRVMNPDKQRHYCEGRMTQFSMVKQLNMKMIKAGE